MSDLHGLAGLYALDALDDLDRRRFEQHLESCEDCRQEVAGFVDTASALAEAEQRTPPPTLRAGVLAEVGQTRQERPVPGARRVRRVAPWLAAAAAVMVALALGAGLLRARSDADRLREVAAVLAAPDTVQVPLEGPAGTSARFVSSADAGAGVLVASGLDEVPAGRTYQLWFIDSSGPHSAGVFEPDDAGSVRFHTVEMPNGVTTIGITEEPSGGSPAPTGDILVAGDVT